MNGHRILAPVGNAPFGRKTRRSSGGPAWSASTRGNLQALDSTAVEVEDFVTDVVNQTTIVADHEKAAGKGAQQRFEYLD